MAGVVVTHITNVGHPSWDTGLNLAGDVYQPDTAVWGSGAKPVVVGTVSGGYTQDFNLSPLDGIFRDFATFVGCVCLRMFVPEALSVPGQDTSTWLAGQTVNGIYPRQSDALLIGVHAMRTSNPFGLTLPLNGTVGVIGGSASGDLALTRAMVGIPGDTLADFAIVFSAPTMYDDRDPDVFHSDGTSNFVDWTKNYNSVYLVPDSPSLLTTLHANSPISLIAGPTGTLTFSPKILHYNGFHEPMPLTQQSKYQAALHAVLKDGNYEFHINTGSYQGIHSFAQYYSVPGVGGGSGRVVAWLAGILGAPPPPIVVTTPLQRSTWLEPGELVVLYDLDLSGIASKFTGNPGPILYFHSGIDPSGTNILQFQGHLYNPFPIQGDGFQWSTRGTLPRPSLIVSNIGSSVSALLREYNDFVGAKLTMHKTFSVYLTGHTEADDTKEFTPEIFVVDRKAAENNASCSFELATPMDAEGILLPRRQVLATACPWLYRGTECGYPAPPSTKGTYPMTGIPVADRTGRPFGPFFSDGQTAAGQTITDGHTVSGSANYQSASAGFSSADLGQSITGTNIPAGTTIIAILSGTGVTMSANATATGTSLSFTLPSRSILTSATANFQTTDVGLNISDKNPYGLSGQYVFTRGTRIVARTSTTVVALDSPVLRIGSGNAFTINRLNGRGVAPAAIWPPIAWIPWTYTDGTSTIGSNTLGSLTAGFVTPTDVGRTIISPNFPGGTTIISVINSVGVHCSANAIATGSFTFTIDQRIFYSQYDTVYVLVGGVRVYAVSILAGSNNNGNNSIYDENFWMLDTCLKGLNDCKWRFGPNNQLPYGGFPGASKLQ